MACFINHLYLLILDCISVTHDLYYIIFFLLPSFGIFQFLMLSIQVTYVALYFFLVKVCKGMSFLFNKASSMSHKLLEILSLFAFVSKNLFISLFFGSRGTSIVVGNYSDSSQVRFLDASGYHVCCSGLNMVWMHSRQMHYPLYYLLRTLDFLSDPLVI